MKIIIRFPNKNLTAKERDKVAITFRDANIICVDKELELWKLNENNKEVEKIF